MLHLRVQCRRLQTQQPGGTSLVTPALLHRTRDQVDFVARDLFVEVDSPAAEVKLLSSISDSVSGKFGPESIDFAREGLGNDNELQNAPLKLRISPGSERVLQ